MANLSELLASVKGLIAGSQELVGVDIGSYAAKAVWLSVTEKTCKLKGWGYAPYPMKPDTPVEEKKLIIAQTLKDLLKKNAITGKAAATSVSGNAVIVRYIMLPRIAKQDIAAVLPTEAEPFIPFDINEVYLGHHVLGEVTEDGQKKMEMVLVAAKKDLIKEKMEIFDAAGINPVVIDVDSFTLETVAGRLGHPVEGPAVMILNIGHKATNLSIIEKGVTRVARDIFIGGNAFTKAISKNLGIEPDKAEELKRKYGIRLQAPVEPAAAAAEASAPAQAESEEAKVANILHDVFKDLMGEIKRSLDFYFSQGPDRTVGKVFLSGGSANMLNLADIVSSELKIPVEVMNPLAILTEQPKEAVPGEALPALTVAAGLALRKMWDWE